MLRHEFKLIDMIDFEMFQIQQENGRNCFDDYLLMTINIDTQFCRLCHSNSEKAYALELGLSMAITVLVNH